MVDKLAISYGYPYGYLNPDGNRSLDRIYDGICRNGLNVELVFGLSDRPILIVSDNSGDSEIDLNDEDAIDGLIRELVEDSNRRERS